MDQTVMFTRAGVRCAADRCALAAGFLAEHPGQAD